MIFLFPETYAYKNDGSHFTFEVGGYYYDMRHNAVLQCVRTSPKGYNFVNVKNGFVHFKSPLYATKFNPHSRDRLITFSPNQRFRYHEIELFHYLRPLEKRTPIMDILHMVYQEKRVK